MCGKSKTSLIEGELVNNITNRSIPMPSPAVGACRVQSKSTCDASGGAFEVMSSIEDQGQENK